MPPSAQPVREIGPEKPRPGPIDDHTCRLIVGSPSLEQLAVWVALLGFDFDIEEPAELHGIIGPIATRLTRASNRNRYNGDPS